MQLNCPGTFLPVPGRHTATEAQHLAMNNGCLCTAHSGCPGGELPGAGGSPGLGRSQALGRRISVLLLSGKVVTLSSMCLFVFIDQKLSCAVGCPFQCCGQSIAVGNEGLNCWTADLHKLPLIEAVILCHALSRPQVTKNLR